VVHKKQLLLDLLARSSVFVQLDGRAEGVELPEWLRGDPQVVLQLGYDLAIPIPDLVVDDDGFSATLSFRRTPHTCKVPWAAVIAIADADGRGALFPPNAPPVEAELPSPAPAAAAPAPPDDKPPRKPRPSHLKLVK
jgi:stringent starvation protein B